MLFLFSTRGSSFNKNQNLMMTSLGSHLGRGEVFGILIGVMTITQSLSPLLFGAGIDYMGFNKALIILIIPLILSLMFLTALLKIDAGNKEKVII